MVYAFLFAGCFGEIGFGVYIRLIVDDLVGDTPRRLELYQGDVCVVFLPYTNKEYKTNKNTIKYVFPTLPHCLGVFGGGKRSGGGGRCIVLIKWTGPMRGTLLCTAADFCNGGLWEFSEMRCAVPDQQWSSERTELRFACSLSATARALAATAGVPKKRKQKTQELRVYPF